MIAVIETEYEGVSHEMFNAGMLYQLQMIYPNEKIVYFCEKKQAMYVKKILENMGSNNITFSHINRIYIAYDKKDIEDNKKEYINIFKKCSKARFVVFLSFAPVNAGLINNIIKRFNHLHFGVCVHGEIEMILPQNNIKFEKNIRILNAAREYFAEKSKWKYFKDNLEKLALLPNCNIILYSDAYKEYKEEIAESLYKKITVLNLPYVFTFDKTPPEDNSMFKIGIMPSSAAAKDQNCVRIIEYMNSQKDRIQYPYKFLIFNHGIGSYDNVGYVKRPGGTRKDIENFMKECDWMLIPYDERKYILSSSGVMFDCIEAERPFFVLNSRSFSRAIAAGCGIQATSIEELGEKIIHQINAQNPNYMYYHESVKKYKKQVEEENLENLKKIFGTKS